MLWRWSDKKGRHGALAACVAAAVTFACVAVAPKAHAAAAGHPLGGVFEIAQGQALTFTNIEFGACNDLTWGYVLNDGALQNQDESTPNCDSQPEPNVTIGPFTADTTARIYLTDNTCRDTYFSNGTPVSHVQISSEGPSGPYTLRFADDGGFCERAGKDAGNFSGYNFTLSVGAESGAPSTPGRPTATDGNHEATVAVASPATGGTPASYTVTAADMTNPDRGGQTCTLASAGVCTVTGLTNGDSYTFTATATNPVRTSAASPPSNPVTPGPPADLAVALLVPPTAEDGSTFTEDVVIANNGPATATNIDTDVFVPAGLTATATGATIRPGTLNLSDPSLGSGHTMVYGVTFKVGARPSPLASMGAVVVDDGYDPYVLNNDAITTIRLLPST